MRINIIIDIYLLFYQFIFISYTINITIYTDTNQCQLPMREEDQLSRLRHLNSNKEVIQIQHDFQKHNKQQELNAGKTQYKAIKTQQNTQDNQDEHQHQHHGGCKHDHGGKKKDQKGTRKNRKLKKNFGIIVYCVFTCLSCFYLEVYCFNTLEEDVHLRKIRSFFSTLVVFMALWSYFQTVRTSNTYTQLKGLPQVIDDPRTQANFLAKQCQHCKYPKPGRVSHCSTCGNCIMKLDHHCIWTQNCIGYRNQKSFYLFTLYMSIGLFQFWKGTLVAFGRMYGTCKFFSFFEPGVYILWIITCFSAFVVGIMIVALLISHTIMILTNHTTLMTMKLKRMCPFPFCQFRQMLLQNDYLNHYDRGQIQNIRSLFGTNIFTAFLPLTRQPTHDFLFEPADPIPTKGQLLAYSGGGQAEVMREQQLRKTILQVKDLYKGQKFKFKGQEIIVN